MGEGGGDWGVGRLKGGVREREGGFFSFCHSRGRGGGS